MWKNRCFPIGIRCWSRARPRDGGGGGRGIHQVFDLAQLESAFSKASALAQAQASFGNPYLFVEKLLTGVRHIEIQVVADQRRTCNFVLKIADYKYDRQMVPVREGELLVVLGPAPKKCPGCKAPLREESFRFCPECEAPVMHA